MLDEKGPSEYGYAVSSGSVLICPAVMRCFGGMELAPDARSGLAAAANRLLWLHRACPSTTLDKDDA